MIDCVIGHSGHSTSFTCICAHLHLTGTIKGYADTIVDVDASISSCISCGTLEHVTNANIVSTHKINHRGGRCSGSVEVIAHIIEHVVSAGIHSSVGCDVDALGIDVVEHIAQDAESCGATIYWSGISQLDTLIQCVKCAFCDQHTLNLIGSFECPSGTAKCASAESDTVAYQAQCGCKMHTGDAVQLINQIRLYQWSPKTHIHKGTLFSIFHKEYVH